MSDTEEKKSGSGCLKVFIVLLVIAVAIFAIIKFVEYQATKNSSGGGGNSDGNLNLVRRSANNGDISIDDGTIDIASLGVKYAVTPKVDIDGLVVTVIIMDKNENELTTLVKSLGDVKKGVQVNFTVSLAELSFTTVLKAYYQSLSVTGGTVSYFA